MDTFLQILDVCLNRVEVIYMRNEKVPLFKNVHEMVELLTVLVPCAERVVVVNFAGEFFPVGFLEFPVFAE